MDRINKYKSILEKELSETVDITTIVVKKPNDLVGAHYASICEFAKICYDTNNTFDELNVFIKKPVQSNENVQQNLFREMFLRESNFFANILKSLTEFCENRNASAIEVEKYFPYCYHADDSEIVMEDLAVKGFTMTNKSEGQDFDQAVCVMNGLAKFHAVSFALIQNTNGGVKGMLELNPLLSEMVSKPEWKEVFGPMYQKPRDIVLQILENVNTESKTETLEFFKNLNTDWFEAAIEPFLTPNLIDVIIHGDCWNNNMMFRVEGSDTEVKFLDLQITRIGSPCSDLTYYMFTSLQSQVRKQWRQLIEIYFNTFLETLAKLDQPFPYKFEDFRQEFVHKLKIGLIIEVLMKVCHLAMSSTDFEKSNGFDHGEFSENAQNFFTNNPEEIKGIAQHITNLVNDYKSMEKLC